MRLYDNAPSSAYEELKTFYPVWYREVLEMDAIWHALGMHLDGLRDGVIKAVDNCFINTANEDTIAQLENFLYITYEGKRTIEERRALVASFFYWERPYRGTGNQRTYAWLYHRRGRS